MYYRIADFQNMVFAKRNYALPEQVLDILRQVESSLDVSESGNGSCTSNTAKKDFQKVFKKTASTAGNGSGSAASLAKYGNGGVASADKGGRGDKPPGYDKRKPNKNKEIVNEDWEIMRNFKTTKINVKTGIDKRWNNMRIMLNKMSQNTFSKIRNDLFSQIEEYISCEEEYCEENTAKIGNNILNLCCGNTFYSALFADLYSELCVKFPNYLDYLNAFVDETFTQEVLDYVDADVNYDEYCLYVKKIEARKSKNTFIVNAMKRGLVSETKVLDIVHWYIETIMVNVIKEGRSGEVAELTENLFLFVNKNASAFAKYDVWNDVIYPAIESLGKSSNKSFPSISNRTVFKFMDILDSL
jgi:hypothetical protein